MTYHGERGIMPFRMYFPDTTRIWASKPFCRRLVHFILTVAIAVYFTNRVVVVVLDIERVVIWLALVFTWRGVRAPRLGSVVALMVISFAGIIALHLKLMGPSPLILCI